MNGKELTQKTIDAIEPPRIGRIDVRDTKVRGLVLRVSVTGARAWSLEYRSPVTGKMARITSAALTLADARTFAFRHKATLSEGRDPMLESKDALQARRIERARSFSVAEALDEYQRDFVAGPKSASRHSRMLGLRRAVREFGDRPVASLTKGELVKRLDAIKHERGPIARNRAHGEIRAWLGWLYQRDHVATIAIDRIRRNAEAARERVLTDAELAAILAGTVDGSPFCDVVRVLMHTGMRRNEVASLQTRDLDFEALTITVRPEVDKIKRGRKVPMADAIRPMLAARAEGLSREQYIFGNGSGFRVPMAGFDDAIKRLRQVMPEGENWTLHDIRRTVATRLHEAGADPLVVEDLLGHISGVRRGVAGTYNRAVTLDKQRDALEAWALRLRLLAGANVIPFRQAG